MIVNIQQAKLNNYKNTKLKLIKNQWVFLKMRL